MSMDKLLRPLSGAFCFSWYNIYMSKLKVIVILTVLFTFSLSKDRTLTPSAPDLPPTVDIVMIDTGTRNSYSDYIKMDKSCEDYCWHPHGEQMAKALTDEVRELRFRRTLNVKQLVWKNAVGIPSLIDQASRLKPKVIVMAFSGDKTVEDEFIALKRASDNNIVLLAASGNEGGQNQPMYPAGYNIPCLIAVSTKEYGEKVPSANLGEIYLERMSGERGTSFSTVRSAAHVLKLFEKYGNLSCTSVKSMMLREFGSTQ
jgi:hypothetical protein